MFDFKLVGLDQQLKTRAKGGIIFIDGICSKSSPWPMKMYLPLNLERRQKS